MLNPILVQCNNQAKKLTLVRWDAIGGRVVRWLVPPFSFWHPCGVAYCTFFLLRLLTLWQILSLPAFPGLRILRPASHLCNASNVTSRVSTGRLGIFEGHNQKCSFPLGAPYYCRWWSVKNGTADPDHVVKDVPDQHPSACPVQCFPPLEQVPWGNTIRRHT